MVVALGLAAGVAAVALTSGARGAAYPVRIDATTQVAKLTAPSDTGGGLGASVAVSADGSTVVAGAPNKTVGDKPGQGAAYLFVKQGGGWARRTVLFDLEGNQGDNFGWSVGVSSDGSTVVVGAPNQRFLSAPSFTYGDPMGAAFVFVRPAGGWGPGPTQPTDELVASDRDADDEFGASVAVSADGSTVVAGSIQAGRLVHGAAYLYLKPSGGWGTGSPHDESARLTASDGDQNDHFGSSVAASSDGSTVVVGSPYASLRGHPRFQGASYLFVKPGRGWASGTEKAKLTASDGALLDNFGSSVAVSSDGSTVVAGAPEDHQPRAGPSPGAAYAFAKPRGGWVSGTQKAELTASDGAAGDAFGASVAVSADGSTVLAGAPGAKVGPNAGQGAAYLFEPAGGWVSGTQKAELTASDGTQGDNFGGVAASSDGSTVVVSAPGAKVGPNPGQGAVYVFAAGGGLGARPPRILTSGRSSTKSRGKAVLVDPGVRVSCPARGNSCTTDERAIAKVAGSEKAKRVIGRAKSTIRAGKRKELVFRLNSRGVRLLHTRTRMRMRVLVLASVGQQRPITAAKRITIHLPGRPGW